MLARYAESNFTMQGKIGRHLFRAMTSRRSLHALFLGLALALCLLRFAYLRADFPDHSPWMLDAAKFTDEGWWASAAVRHFVLGHWQIAGDYNPAAAVPVWPTLLMGVFQFTGVSIVAARSVSVIFSIATVGLVYLLLRRYETGGPSAALGALLMAASPFAFAFSRLATLDTMVLFEFCFLLWIASHASTNRLWLSCLLGVLVALTLLTKTTALVLLPSVLWLAGGKRSLRTILIVVAAAGAGFGLYVSTILHSRYADDYRYFFEVNAMTDVEWRRSWSLIQQLFRNSRWIDRILYTGAMAVLFLSLTWFRQLWRNRLFAASWIAFAGQAVFILRRQDDYAPRYFLVMLVPVILVLILALRELRARARNLTLLLAASLAVALLLNTAQILRFLRARQYQFVSAAQSIQNIVNADRNTHRLLLGSSADQLALMTGIPAINDGYTNEDLEEKAARYQPGWYVGWNQLEDEYRDALTAYRLDRVATFHVFDHPDRDSLILYRMVPVTH